MTSLPYENTEVPQKTAVTNDLQSIIFFFYFLPFFKLFTLALSSLCIRYALSVVEVRISLTQELSCNLCSPPWEWATMVRSPRSLMKTKEGARVKSSSILGEKNEKMRRFRLRI